jgi:hypothetical protein
MKRKLSAVILTLLLTACSASQTVETTQTTAETTAAISVAARVTTAKNNQKPDEPDPLATGKVINIHIYDKAQQELIESLYTPPEGYSLEFSFISEKTYRDKLTGSLKKNEKQKPDERIDLFLADMDYMRAFVESDYSLPLEDLGFSDDDTAAMYPYTIAYGTDTPENTGKLKAMTWYVTPDVYVYRRSYADKWLLSSDPAVMEQMIGTWNDLCLTADFLETSSEDGRRDYSLASSGAEFIRPLAQHAETPPIIDDAFIYPESWQLWYYINIHLTNADFFWVNIPYSEGWLEDMKKNGRVLGYVGSIDLINGVLTEQALSEEDGTFGDWLVCPATLPSADGGAFIFAAAGTDNPDIAADIIRTLCLNEETLRGFGTDLIPNHMDIVAEYAASADFNAAVLGGQNPYVIYDKVAKKVPATCLHPYGDIAEQFANFTVTERVIDNDAAKDLQAYILRKYPGVSAPRFFDYETFSEVFDGDYYSFTIY